MKTQQRAIPVFFSFSVGLRFLDVAVARLIRQAKLRSVVLQILKLCSVQALIFSGPTAIWGVGATNAARLRFAQANEAGGVWGAKDPLCG